MFVRPGRYVRTNPTVTLIGGQPFAESSGIASPPLFWPHACSRQSLAFRLSPLTQFGKNLRRERAGRTPRPSLDRRGKAVMSERIKTVSMKVGAPPFFLGTALR
jgi:hypothetical protein